ncbi:hypothetical protein BN1708_020309, partial [Verticillium longisporum]
AAAAGGEGACRGQR